MSRRYRTAREVAELIMNEDDILVNLEQGNSDIEVSEVSFTENKC